MKIILHESPFVDSIYHVPVEMYIIEQDISFRGIPTVHEHIILNQNCAVITFHINDEVFVSETNVVCGKFTQPPKINIIFKNACKKLTVIRLNSFGMYKLTDIPISSLVNSITSGSKISIDLSDESEMEHSITWIETMMKNEEHHKAYTLTRDIIHYIDENFSDLPSSVNKAISKQFGLSESTLLRYFKKYIGINMSTYILTLRRQKMMQSMCNNNYDSMSVRENGYYDQSHFLNDFKRLFGISLKDYFHEMKRMKKRSPDLVRFLYD